MKNYSQPNTLGRFGEYGGMYVSETLMPLLLDLDQSYQKIQKDKKFHKELEDLFKNYVGRPSALHHAKNLSPRATDQALSPPPLRTVASSFMNSFVTRLAILGFRLPQASLGPICRLNLLMMDRLLFLWKLPPRRFRRHEKYTPL